MSRPALCAVLLFPLTVAAAAGGSFYTAPFTKRPTASALTELGRVLFFDPALSGSGKMSCATCHDPAFAFGPPNDLAVQLGGPDGTLPGIRAVPSLRYLQAVPPFTEHYFEDDGNDSEDQGPSGGRTWDGREDTAHDQARVPLLSPFEMANADLAAVVAKVEARPYAARFREAFGGDVFERADLGQTAILWALEVFQQSPADFYPYDSKFDAYLRGQVKLSPAEMRGLALFDDERKGNCASCHFSAVRGGAFPNFSDFGFIAIGVPRNKQIPANSDPAYHDLGLCGPLRTEFAKRDDYCGLFRTPVLRNVALRRTFFHNGAVHELRQAVEFYVQRDTDPGRWYARGADGVVDPYDDLPAKYRDHLNRDPPFGRKPEDPPALDPGEIDDVVAFLRTLSDGYRP